MERERNTNKLGQPFKTSIIDAVWKKAHPIAGSNPDKFRKDDCGALMVKSSFGKDSQFGWEIDHILPISKGGKDDLANLQPLHWKNNEGKADDHPNWICVIKEN
jgi:5-methylcytosine-specific restriction endonuclease McrA